MATKSVLISISAFTDFLACFWSFFGAVLGHVWHPGGGKRNPKTLSQKMRLQGGGRDRFLVVLGWLLEATGVLFGTVFDHNNRKNQCQRILSKKRAQGAIFSCFAVFCSCFLGAFVVCGAWGARGARRVWCVLCGVLCVVRGVWCGVWCVVCGVWCVVCCVWCVVCGVWCVVCGVWCVMCVVCCVLCVV